MEKKLSVKLIVIITVSCIVLAGSAIMLGLYLGTVQHAEDYLEIPMVELPRSARETIDRTTSYLGHPDLALADNGDIIAVYPAGHGKGNVILKRYTVHTDSTLRSWGERQQTPFSWSASQETPTIYHLTLSDGSTKTVLISGCPYWPDGNYKANGFNCSVGDGNGKNWTEFTNWYGEDWAAQQSGRKPYDAIVAMSSLTRMRDENGAFIDKWMGTFHDHEFTNYYTYLTFDSSGNAVWSEPAVFMPDALDKQHKYGLCEMEIVPASDCLIMLGRANNRNTLSLGAVSYDWGETWTDLVELPYCLTGDRHKAEYDPTTGKWLVSYRQVLPGKPHIFSSQKIFGDGWVAWTGSEATLKSLALGKTDNGYGDALILLGENYGGSLDCGYSGTVCVNGEFTLASYGRFERNAINPYIMAVTFRLSDIL